MALGLVDRSPGPSCGFGFLLAVLCALALPTFALGQSSTPFVADEWRFGTRQARATLSYCIDKRDPDWPVARAIAAAVAGALLLRPQEYLIGEDPSTTDMSGEDLDDTYRLLLQHCDVAFGFKLVPDAYPAWLTITRPYYRAAYVYAVADTTWKSLADMPVTRAIGATVGTSADMRLSQYILSVPVSKRWDKDPMASDEAALRAVVEGSTGAALVWAPAYWALRNTEPTFAILREIAPTPLPVSTADIGAILLNKQSFLRENVDQAIASLTRDGSIASILKEQDFPGTPVP
jgi:polar amino acid transport system substrate-binding protein